MARKKKYDRKSQETIRFYVDEETKYKVKLYALQNQTTLQSIFEEVAKNIATESERGI